MKTQRSSSMTLKKGRYRAYVAQDKSDIRDSQELRARCFQLDYARDADSFDALCDHILVRETGSGRLVCSFRMMPLTGATIAHSYSAQYYELSALKAYQGRMVEMGRFCIDPDVQDADVLRIAWGAMTRFVDDGGIDLLFGCSSFTGTETGDYLDAFAMLKEKHLAPKRWLPRVKAPNVFRFATRLVGRKPDRRKAMLRMPPLLKTYLLMGGWVSDHAVVDPHMNTLHVFTGVEIGAIPDSRKKLLRAVAG